MQNTALVVFRPGYNYSLFLLSRCETAWWSRSRLRSVLLPVVDGGVGGDDVVECADRGIMAVSGAGFVVELVGDGGEAVDRSAVDTECLTRPFGGTVNVAVSEGHDGEGEPGFAGAPGAAIGTVGAAGEPEDFLGVLGGAGVVMGDAVAVRGVEVPFGGVDDEMVSGCAGCS